MSKKVTQAKKKLQKAKTPAEALRILAELKAKDPVTYAALKNSKGS